jgi:hypothetical protein
VLWLLLPIGLVIGFFVLKRAADRFERRQRALGRWDEEGPLVETEAPPAGVKANRMSWHLEAVGRWRGRVLRDRRRKGRGG